MPADAKAWVDASDASVESFGADVAQRAPPALPKDGDQHPTDPSLPEALADLAVGCAGAATGDHFARQEAHCAKARRVAPFEGGSGPAGHLPTEYIYKRGGSGRADFARDRAGHLHAERGRLRSDLCQPN